MKGGLDTVWVHSPMLRSLSVSSNRFSGTVCVRLWLRQADIAHLNWSFPSVLKVKSPACVLTELTSLQAGSQADYQPGLIVEFKQSLARSSSLTTRRTTMFSIKEAHSLYFLVGVNCPSLQNPYHRGGNSECIQISSLPRYLSLEHP